MKPRLDVFIFADALGWKLTGDRQFLADLLPVRNRCETLLGYSSTCDPTILTGLLPRDHGHFSFFVKADGPSPFAALRPLAILPEVLAGHHRVRNRLSRLLQKALGYSGYFQLYSVPFDRLARLDYTEKRDIYLPGGILGGQRIIFEDWQDSAKPWVRSDWRRSDSDNIAHARREIEKGEIELIYLFTSRLDAVMHRHGTSHPTVDAAFDDFADNVRQLADLAARHYREVRLHLFSDHGMADVTVCSNLRLRFERQPWRFGRDYTAVWDSTMARLWFHHDQARKEITAYLHQQQDGRLLTDDELDGYGCLFPDRRYGEAFYLLPTGSLFVPSFLNQRKVTAMHGYAPEDEDSAACWLSNVETRPVRHLTDIHGVMLDAALAR